MRDLSYSCEESKTRGTVTRTPRFCAGRISTLRIPSQGQPGLRCDNGTQFVGSYPKCDMAIAIHISPGQLSGVKRAIKAMKMPASTEFQKI